jgi:hypothetical protein
MSQFADILPFFDTNYHLFVAILLFTPKNQKDAKRVFTGSNFHDRNIVMILGAGIFDASENAFNKLMT